MRKQIPVVVALGMTIEMSGMQLQSEMKLTYRDDNVRCLFGESGCERSTWANRLARRPLQRRHRRRIQSRPRWGVAMSLGGEEGGMLVFCACEDDRNCAKVARV